ncbi:ABC transporter permease [Thermomonospora umbrina]|uniref:Putative ABC transport system permease protein n=1 Tax=Thermomonospora umbrina TaxID=111806 RepID=A0A3D9STY2_9ACTN|nr:FtsX-like permease family protein [Thermomonospora umbrina]REE97950.1 putative ABC transport system permease protein [Thermomonospora umbrina]
MLKTSLANLRAHRLRLLMTAVAITLGVGFIAGTFVLTDTLQAGVDEKFGGSASKVSVAVLPGAGARGLPPALLDEVRTLPGVTDAQGLVEGDAALIGKDGKVYGDQPTVGLSLSPGRLQRYDIEAGRAPAAPNEAVLDERTARRNGFRVGSTITVLDPRGARVVFTLTGLADLGINDEVAFRGGVGFTPATALRMTGSPHYREIDVLGSGDTAALRATVAAAAAGHEVLSGRELGDRLARGAGADMKIIRTGLLIFGAVSMAVSALVIYNTFAILIAQRMRELALLRCVGATRRQVFVGVLLESAAVGLAGSLAGLAVGVGLAAGALSLLGGAGAEVPTGSLTLSPAAVAFGLLVGVVVTVLSALLPARAATRVAPIAALRSDLEPGGGRFRLGWPRRILATVLSVLGLASGVLGSLVMEKGETAMFVVAIGGGVLFLAVIALMPSLVRPLSRVAGALPARLTGVPGRLAVANSRRSPRRTATTTIALTIGVGLMSLFAVVAASGRATGQAELREHFPVDLQLHTQYTGDDGPRRRLPAELGDALRARPELKTVTEMRVQDTTAADGAEIEVGTVTRSSLGELVKPEIKSGSLTDLRPGTVAVHDRETSAAPGDTVRVRTRAGLVPLKVAAVFAGDTPLPPYVLSEQEFARHFGPQGPLTIFVNVREGVDPDAAAAAAEAAARPFPTAKIASAAALREQFDKAIDTMLMIFGGLLALAIVIALFGIANTLSLSVVERTRESALLRALGITRSQLRLMLSVEAVIMAVIGALTGVLLGSAFGWAAIEALTESSVFAYPYLQVAALMALAALAGLAAAVLPARRAARTSVVESLTHA